MKFKQILQFMKRGYKVKLPAWGGYWELGADGKSVIMHMKDGSQLNDCTERLFYTIENVLSDEWMIANEENTPTLGGEALFGFDDAIRYAKRAYKLARKVWEKYGDDRYITLSAPVKYGLPQPYIYIVKGKTPEPWYPTHADMMANDWYFVEEDR